MLYKDITQSKITSETVLFRFNLNNLTYVSNDNEVEGTLYVPTTSERDALLEEYNSWCTQFKQTPSEVLINDLNNLDKFKFIKAQELKKVTATFEENLNKDMYFTSSLGFKSDGDRRTRSNIEDLIQFFDLQAQDGKVPYRDYNNETQELTKEQLGVLLKEQIMNGKELYNQKWALEDAINRAKTVEDLKNINIKFSMSDFSSTSQKLNNLF